MVFSSMIFLWFFLPIVLIGNFVIKESYRNIFLLLASLFFYAWGEPVYILLMLFSILINWIFGICIEKFYAHKRIYLIMAVMVNILLLGFFKYFNFLIEILNSVLDSKIEIKEIALPIGISFFTFQALSYLIDLYRGEYKAQKNILNLALYISFFPQLIAGPIIKYKDISVQLTNRTITAQKTAEGMRRFVYGLGKKVLIANTLAQSVDWIYGLEYADLSCGLAWTASVFYTLQIYYDFSGYSDMAIGLGKVFGFDFQENFNYPYLASSVQDFWRRWHISLGTWFREYLYIPLGGNRQGKKTYLNLIIVFLVTGLWHGANYTFILWGGYYGILSVIERLGLKHYLARHQIMARVYTLLIIIFGWTIFRSDSVIEAAVFLKHMILPWKFTETNAIIQNMILNKTIFIAILGIVGCGIIQKIGVFPINKWKYSYIELIYCVSVLLLSIASLAGNTYNPFIYFRF